MLFTTYFQYEQHFLATCLLRWYMRHTVGLSLHGLSEHGCGCRWVRMHRVGSTSWRRGRAVACLWTSETGRARTVEAAPLVWIHSSWAARPPACTGLAVWPACSSGSSRATLSKSTVCITHLSLGKGWWLLFLVRVLCSFLVFFKCCYSTYSILNIYSKLIK